MGPNSASSLRLDAQKTVDTREMGLLAFDAVRLGGAAFSRIVQAM